MAARRAYRRSGSLRPETRAGGRLAFVEAAAWSAGLPGAGSLAAAAEAEGFYAATLFRQWEILHLLLAERLAEADDPTQAAHAYFAGADPRARFLLPGAWTRWRAGRSPEESLHHLRVWARGAEGELADALPVFGVRPWAELLGAEILPLLAPWLADADPALRRAAVVALRPRGTWVTHLDWAVEQPSLLVPFLERMGAEPDPRVAGAVGHLLNDVAQRTPELVLALLHRWREERPGPELDRIARGALRGLLKQGDPRALYALGLPELDLAAEARLRGAATVAPNRSLLFELRVRNRGAAGPAHLVVEIETPGRVSARPRRHREPAGTYLLPRDGELTLLVRERLFDRRAAPLIEGAARARFFLNGAECAQAEFRIRRDVAADRA